MPLNTRLYHFLNLVQPCLSQCLALCDCTNGFLHATLLEVQPGLCTVSVSQACLYSIMYDSRQAELKVVGLMQNFLLACSRKPASDAFEVSQSDSAEATILGQP